VLPLCFLPYPLFRRAADWFILSGDVACAPGRIYGCPEAFVLFSKKWGFFFFASARWRKITEIAPFPSHPYLPFWVHAFRNPFTLFHPLLFPPYVALLASLILFSYGPDVIVCALSAHSWGFFGENFPSSPPFIVPSPYAFGKGYPAIFSIDGTKVFSPLPSRLVWEGLRAVIQSLSPTTTVKPLPSFWPDALLFYLSPVPTVSCFLLIRRPSP